MKRSLARTARRVALVGAAGVLLLSGSLSGSAGAAPDADPTPRLLANRLIGPLSAAVSDDGTVYFTQNFAGALMRRAPGRAPRTDFRSTGPEVGGVSVVRRQVTFTTTGGRQLLRRIGLNAPDPKATVVADLGAYEQSANPDGDVRYGLEKVSTQCAQQWPVDQLGPPQYDGIVESHPYGTALDGPATYVADAAGNDILRVMPDGTVSTVAVLPAQPVKITAQIAEQNGIPECAIGLTYDFEPVPTDVEVGPDGRLYVSTLSGGLALGGVYTVNPRNGTVTPIAGGFVGGTGLAVADDGDLYVAQLFAGSIEKISHGQRSTFVQTPMPAAVEVAGDQLYATVNALSGLGEIERFGPGAGGRFALAAARAAEAPNGKLVRYSLP